MQKLIYLHLVFLVACASSNMNAKKTIEEMRKTIKQPKKHWALSFNDKDLIALIKEARKKNYDLENAAASVEKSVAMANQAGANLKPNLDLSLGQSGASKNIPIMRGTSLGAQVSWELDLWGRMKAGEQAAQASTKAVAADFLYAQYSIDAATAKAYFSVIEAKLQEQLANENLQVNRKIMKIVEVKFDNGLSQAQDLSLTRASLANASQTLEKVSQGKRMAMRSLETILGRYPSAKVATKKTFPPVPSNPPKGVPSSLLEDRPDMVAAEQRVAVAFNRVKEAKAARLPRLSLTAQGGGVSNQLGNIANPANAFWNLGANLLAPVFDGGKRKAQVEISTAEQKQAVALYKKAALNAFAETEVYLDDGEVLQNRLREVRKAVMESKKALDIAQLRYKEGETELLDVLNVQQKLMAAKTDEVSLQSLLLSQRVNLYLALGGHWQEKNKRL